MLNDDFRESLIGGGHELVHELGGLFEGRTRSSKTDVEGIVSDLLSVGSHAAGQRGAFIDGASLLKDNWETARWVDTSTSDVKVQLADGDTHSTDSEITETENTGSIGDDDDSGLVGEGRAVGREESREFVLFVSEILHKGA